MKKLNKDFSTMENTVEAYLCICDCLLCTCDCHECAGYVGSANVQSAKDSNTLGINISNKRSTLS